MQIEKNMYMNVCIPLCINIYNIYVHLFLIRDHAQLYIVVIRHNKYINIYIYVENLCVAMPQIKCEYIK